MKSLFVLFLALGLLSSCQKEDAVEAKADAYPQTWQLVQLSGSLPGFTKTGADLPWQETYVFRADSTFTKTRRKDGQLQEANGTFLAQNNADGLSLILTYPTRNSILNNCSAAPQETLQLTADDSLVGSSQACDGPRLEYKKSR